jgi:hypothetical protein
MDSLGAIADVLSRLWNLVPTITASRGRAERVRRLRKEEIRKRIGSQHAAVYKQLSPEEAANDPRARHPKRWVRAA